MLSILGGKVVDFLPQPVSHEIHSESGTEVSDVSHEAGSRAYRRFSDEGPETKDMTAETGEQNMHGGAELKVDEGNKIGGVDTGSVTASSSGKKAQFKKESEEPVVKKAVTPPLKINTESFYGNSSSYIPQSDPFPSPRFTRPVDPLVSQSKSPPTASDTMSSTVPTIPSTETSPSAVNGIWKERRDVKEIKDTTTSSSKGYRHRPDPLWRSVHSDGNCH